MTVANTTNYDLPYPDLNEDPNVPSDVQALAEKLDLVLTALEEAYVPIGTIAMFGGAAAPPRWALCDGSFVDQVGPYADLFAVIGHTYAIGHGAISGKFLLPDFRSRAPIGPDGSANILSADDLLGYNGGEATHTLDATQIPAHTHNDGSLATDSRTPWPSNPAWNAPIADTSWQETQVSIDMTSMISDLPVAGNPLANDANITYTPGTHSHDVTGATGSIGGGAPHNNMPPYLVVNYIIRYI